MKINKLKQIIQKELKTLKEQRMRAPGPAMPSMGGMSNPKPSVSSMPSAACLAAINNAASTANNMGQLSEKRTKLNENIWMRFRGAIKKIFTDCGDLYDESGGPVGQ